MTNNSSNFNAMSNLDTSLCFAHTVLVSRSRLPLFKLVPRFSRSATNFFPSSTSSPCVTTPSRNQRRTAAHSSARRTKKKPRAPPTTVTASPAFSEGLASAMQQSAVTSATRTTTSATKPSTVGETPKRKQASFFSKLHRLRSIEDRRWLHKIGSISCILSTVSLSAYGLVSNAYSTLSLPPSTLLHPLVTLWAASVTVQSLSGGYMALKFRGREHCVRDAFVANSILSLLSVTITLRTLYHHVSSMAVLDHLITPLCALSMAYVLKTLCFAKQTIQSRKAPARHFPIDQNSARGKLRDFCTYILPEAIPIPFIVAAFNFFGLHDHSWVSHQFHTGAQLKEVCIYTNVLGTLVVSFVSLLVTLRDRKMISKSREGNLIFMSSLASLGLTLWLIHGSPGIPYFLDLVALNN